MKGVVLAGGRGTRLRPFTHIIKKELLPVYDKPLIYYPLRTLRDSGIAEVIIVVDPKSVGAFMDVIGEGKELGMSITYAIQNESLGMAHALLQARHMIKENESIMVIGGDNIFSEAYRKVVSDFTEGAVIFTTQAPDPQRYGVVYFQGDKVERIDEKPAKPRSSWIGTALYIYDGQIWSFIENLKPSVRGEYEITDVNNAYIQKGKMRYVKITGTWFDAGTFDSLLEASLFMARRERALGGTKGLPRNTTLIAP